jgi:hypothetical protein
VATSNVEPDRLYEGGLNRALFLPFIDQLKERVAVGDRELVEAEKPRLRRQGLGHRGDRVVAPCRALPNVEPDRLYEGGLNRALFLPFIDQLKERVAVVRLDSRTGIATSWPLTWIAVGRPCASPDRARNAPVRAAAAAYTVIVDGIPVMDLAQRNEAKRFIILVDALYDTRKRATPPAASGIATSWPLTWIAVGRPCASPDRARIHLRGSLRPAARCGRLPGSGRALPHRDRGRHPGDGPCASPDRARNAPVRAAAAASSAGTW